MQRIHYGNGPVTRDDVQSRQAEQEDDDLQSGGPLVEVVEGDAARVGDRNVSVWVGGRRVHHRSGEMSIGGE